MSEVFTMTGGWFLHQVKLEYLGSYLSQPPKNLQSLSSAPVVPPARWLPSGAYIFPKFSLEWFPRPNHASILGWDIGMFSRRAVLFGCDRVSQSPEGFHCLVSWFIGVRSIMYSHGGVKLKIKSSPNCSVLAGTALSLIRYIIYHTLSLGSTDLLPANFMGLDFTKTWCT